ncbi:hypothetical protein KEJ20_07865 [Candidatus Bathyarchaeota archaeon]|nr:hypothetical protein [Candidatus Bathyarchaeota archaeon]
MKKLKNIKSKGVNTVISSLLLISIATATALLSYYYIMNYTTPPSTKPIEIIQIDNVIWFSQNKILAYISNYGSVKRVIEVAFIDGNRGFPSALVEVNPGETKIIEFTFENNIQPGEHLIKVVCQDGTLGLLTYRFLEPSTITTTSFTTTTLTTTTTTETSPCFIVQAYYDAEKSTVLPAVRVIQSFRDNIIAKSSIGFHLLKVFNSLYYPLSKFLTPLVMKYPTLSLIVKIALSPVLVLTLFLINFVYLLNSEIKFLSFILINSVFFCIIYLKPASLTKKRSINALKDLTFITLILTLTLEALSLSVLASTFMIASILCLTFLLITLLFI